MKTQYLDYLEKIRAKVGRVWFTRKYAKFHSGLCNTYLSEALGLGELEGIIETAEVKGIEARKLYRFIDERRKDEKSP